MLTRPTIPGVLKVLSRAARDQAGAREFSESAASELFISSQMLSYLARRAELEPDQILEEMAVYEDLGHQVVREGLGEADTILKAGRPPEEAAANIAYLRRMLSRKQNARGDTDKMVVAGHAD